MTIDEGSDARVVDDLVASVPGPGGAADRPAGGGEEGLSPGGALSPLPARLRDRLVASAERISPRILRAPRRLDPAARQLEEYFARRRRQFEVPIDLRLAHGFRRTVLECLQAVDYGTTQSYTTLARAAG